MKKLVIGTAAAAVCVAMSAAPAFADTGKMGWGEYQEHHQGETKDSVENLCDCTGHKLSEWSGGEFKMVGYTPTDGFPTTLGDPTRLIELVYRYWGGGWHLNTEQLRCSASRCVSDPY